MRQKIIRIKACIKNNKSGFKGVCWAKRESKWAASISINKELKFLGCFNTQEEAYERYCEYALKNGYTNLHIYGN